MSFRFVFDDDERRSIRIRHVKFCMKIDREHKNILRCNKCEGRYSVQEMQLQLGYTTLKLHPENLAQGPYVHDLLTEIKIK